MQRPIKATVRILVDAPFFLLEGFNRLRPLSNVM